MPASVGGQHPQGFRGTTGLSGVLRCDHQKVQAAPSFHGRQAQLTLDEVLGRASAGQPQVALITGDAGIGRVTYPPLGRPSAIGARAAVAGRSQGAGLRHGGPAPGRPGRPPKEPDGLHNVLMAGGALLQAFSECQADSHTGVVVIDDIQWADDASLSALAFAARRLRRDRILVVTAARVAPVEATGLTRLARDPTGTEIHLQGLTWRPVSWSSVSRGYGWTRSSSSTSTTSPTATRSGSGRRSTTSPPRTCARPRRCCGRTEPRAQRPAAVEPLSAQRHVLRAGAGHPRRAAAGLPGGVAGGGGRRLGRGGRGDRLGSRWSLSAPPRLLVTFCAARP